MAEDGFLNEGTFSGEEDAMMPESIVGEIRRAEAVEASEAAAREAEVDAISRRADAERSVVNRDVGSSSGKNMIIKIDILRGSGMSGDWWHRVPSPLNLKKMDASTTILALKKKIQSLTQIPHEEQELHFNGEVLLDNRKLRHYQIRNGYHLTLSLSAIGELRRKLREKDQVIWEKDFMHSEELQAVKSSAMSSLVDDVELSFNPDLMGQRARLVYLTQPQVTVVMERIDEFIRVFHGNSHGLVLKFLGSYGCQDDVIHGYGKGHTEFPYMHSVPELSAADQSVTEQYLHRVVQEVILPLAMRTHALVIVEATRDCGLSAAVRRVLSPVLDRMGDSCPFTLVGIASAPTVREYSCRDRSVAHRLKEGRVVDSGGKWNSWKLADEIYRRKGKASGFGGADWGRGPPSIIEEGNEEEEEASETGEQSLMGRSMNDNATYVSAIPIYFEEGMRVEARYWGFAKYYPGIVTRDRGNGTYDIDYDDGERETGVAAEMIRPMDPNFDRKSAALSALQHKSRDIDLADGLSHYIILEGPHREAVEKLFLDAASLGVNVLAFQTYGVGKMRELADLCFRGIPLLLLDSRERFFTMPTPQHTGKPVSAQLRTSLAAKSLAMDEQLVLKQVSVMAHQAQQRPLRDFFVAEDALRRLVETFQEAGFRENYDGSTLAFLHSVLNPGKAAAPEDELNPMGTLKLHEAIKQAGKKRKAGTEATRSGAQSDPGDSKEKMDQILRMFEYVSRYNDAFCFYNVKGKLNQWLFPFGPPAYMNSPYVPMPPSNRPSSGNRAPVVPRQLSSGPGSNMGGGNNGSQPGNRGNVAGSVQGHSNVVSPNAQRALEGGGGGAPAVAQSDIDQRNPFPELLDEELYGIPAAWLRDDESRLRYSTPVTEAEIHVKEHAKALHADLQEWHTSCGHLMERWQPDSDMAISVSKILSCDTVYSASIFDINSIHGIVTRVTEHQRLPKSSSYESLLLIRDAWDAVDIYHHIARTYKRMTYASYILLLVCAILMAAGPVVRNELGLFKGKYLRLGVLAMSIFMACVATFFVMFNPASKWHGLRAAALALEAEIFKFRCRVSDYKQELISVGDRGDAGAEGATLKKDRSTLGHNGTRGGGMSQAHGRGASMGHEEERLRQKIMEVRQRVTDGNYLKLTALNRAYSDSVYTKYQYRPTNSCCGGCGQPTDRMGYMEEGQGYISPDLHFAPMTANEYLAHRVNSAMHTYREKIPRYVMMRSMSHSALIFGSLSGVALAILKYTNWAGILAACAITSTAWLEFHGTSKKISRCSTLVTDLQNLKTWWNSLSPEEHSIQANAERLVLVAEGVLADERAAWASESRASVSTSHSGGISHFQPRRLHMDQGYGDMESYAAGGDATTLASRTTRR